MELSNYYHLLKDPFTINNTIITPLVLALIAFMVLTYYKVSDPNKNLPPGSCGPPLIGESISFVRALTKNKPVEWIRERVNRHGPVFKTSLMGCKTVILTGQEGNRFVFGGADGALTLNQPKTVVKIFGKYGLFEMSGQRHKIVRGAVAAFLRPETIQRYLGQMEFVVKETLSKALDGKDTVHIVPLIKKVTFNVVSNIFFGLPDGEERDEFLEDFTAAVKGMWSVPVDFPGTAFHRAVKARQKLSEKLSKIIGVRRKEIEEGSPCHDVITSLLLLNDENEEPLPVFEVIDVLVGLIIASHDTVAIVLTHFIRLLARDSQVFQRVSQEHREVAKAKRERSNGDEEGKNLDWNDVLGMKYTWRVAQELMRLDPPVFGNFRRVVRDTKFGTYDIPKGWQVFWVSSETHLDNNIFEDPHKFDPSRFSNPTKSYPPYTYIPFGAGPRICPGAEFTRVEILHVIHHMVTKYRWTEIIPDEPITRQPAPLPAMGLPVRLYPINDT